MVRFVFFGTSLFAVTVLQTLHKRALTPTLIVTTPDKPKGRGHLVSPSPAALWAKENRIELFQPAMLNSNDVEERLNTQIAELFIVADYGKIIPRKILDIPKKGVLNIHPSLLPKYRGPSPIESAIMNNESETGITIMLLDEAMDHGPILAQKKSSIRFPVRAAEATRQLATEGADVLAEILADYLAGVLKPTEQNHSEASYTKKFGKSDGLINLDDDPSVNWRKFLALSDSIGVYFIADRKGKKVKVKIADADMRDGKLLIKRVIPENRREMKYEDFLRG